ncbi:hypothetical protein GUITHDRAFT_58183, partial [Guillardia theta CCMP2712]
LEAARKEKDLGNDKYKEKKLQEALVHYTRSLDLLPRDNELSHLVLSNRALVHIEQRNFLQAEKDCSDAIEIHSRWAKAWHRRGVARCKQGKLEEAMKDLEEALKIEPN